jgi:cell division protein FtsZ
MDEIGQITDYIQSAAGEGADLIWGNGTDPSLNEFLNVTVIATGFGTNSIPELYSRQRTDDVIPLDGEKSVNRKVNQSIFEVKDKPAAPPKRIFAETDTRQKTIEFEVNNSFASENYKPAAKQNDFEFQIKTVKPETAQQEQATERITRSQPTPILPKDSIDLMEKIPAYQRKNIQIDEATHSDNPKLSRYKLNIDDNDSLLKNDNSYLHDNVD